MEENARKQMGEYREKINLQRCEVAKRIVGMPNLIEALFICFYTFGERKSIPHILVEGKVGQGKTATLEAFAQTISGLTFNRIQFTPDLKPIDLLRIVEQCQDRTFVFHDGPLFANLVLADEINRADDKTRAALLEVMAEEQISIGKKTFKLDKPFFVMATENPSETEGVFRIGAAQSDRFMMKVYTEPLPREEEMKIVGDHLQKAPEIKQILTKQEVLDIREFIRQNIFVDPKVIGYAVDIVSALRPEGGIINPEDFYLLPESVRPNIFLVKGAMTKAFFDGRDYVLPSDIEHLAFPVIHHRIEFKYSSNTFEKNIAESKKLIIQAVRKAVSDEAGRT